MSELLILQDGKLQLTLDGKPLISPSPIGILVKDETVLAAEIGETNTKIAIRDENNYAEASALSVLRIGDELITYGEYDKEKRLLLGCVRGAYGTRAVVRQ